MSTEDEFGAAVSPDGRTIVFTKQNATVTDLWITHYDGSRFGTPLPGPFGSDVDSTGWGDATHLYYLEGGATEMASTFSPAGATFDSGQATHVFDAVGMLVVRPSISGDGQDLYFEGQGTPAHIMHSSWSATTNDWHAATEVTELDSAGGDEQPAIRSDGLEMLIVRGGMAYTAHRAARTGTFIVDSAPPTSAGRACRPTARCSSTTATTPTSSCTTPCAAASRDYASALTASTTSSTWPLTLTFGQWRATLPVLSMRTVDRMMPFIFLPYITLSPQAP